MRHANDIIGQILLIGFFVIAGVTPLVIIVLSVLSFVRNAPRRVAIVLKAIAALVIWSILTFLIVMIFIMVVFSYSAPTDKNAILLNAVFTLEGVFYLLIGLALIYWMKRQARRTTNIPVP